MTLIRKHQQKKKHILENMKKNESVTCSFFFDPPTWKCACRSHFPLSTSKMPSVGAVVVQLVRTQNDEMKGEMLRRRTEITG